MTITQIEKMTEAEAKEIALETMEIKGHNIYFVEIDGGFGYSYMVFKNDHQMKYANDYELHHSRMAKEKGKEALRDYYIGQINAKLFDEEDFSQPLKTYDEYSRKKDYLYNYYILQVDYISAFNIFHNDEEEKAFDEKIKGKIYDPVGFGYVDPKYKDFVEKHIALVKELNKQMNNTKNNYEYNKNAFKYEMHNHEYSINWQADYDVLSVFGRIEYHDNDVNKYFDELNFTDTQRNAYIAARREYYREIDRMERAEAA